MSKATTYTVPIDDDKAGARLDKVLAEAVGPLSRSRVQALMAEGCVTRDGKPVDNPSAKARSGDVFVIQVPAPAPAAPVPQDIPLDVVYEDAHLIVVDKPAGLVVHPAAGHGDGTLVNALLHHCEGSLSGVGGVTRPGIVHRLDKDTSGLIVAAKDDAAHQGLARQFADHSIERAYRAVVWGRPRQRTGTVEGLIGRSPRNRKKMAVLKRGGKFARTHFRILDDLSGALSLVECRLETGRTHQIRVHMASLGHAVVGDPLYGGGQRKLPASADPVIQTALANVEGQILHAYLLGFSHPVTGDVSSFVSNKFNKIMNLFHNFDEI